MHYQHRYHAGNFADVFKHVLLIGLIEALNQKDSPWAYLDTHAGAGRYARHDEAQARTGEAETGAARLLAAPPSPQPWLARYQALLQAAPRELPGSPAVAAALRRPADRLMFCEPMPAVVAALREAMTGPGIAVHDRDGYGAWALLPPPEKRGLILVDPPFEARDEFERMTAFAEQALARFAHGIYALWYPVKNRHAADAFVRRLGRKLAGREALDARLFISHPQDGRMRGCGLTVINPPYAFRQALPAALDALVPLLAQGEGARRSLINLENAS
jgi:23S rRNA (adenine2030-N6)-methyltransferase